MIIYSTLFAVYFINNLATMLKMCYIVASVYLDKILHGNAEQEKVY